MVYSFVMVDDGIVERGHLCGHVAADKPADVVLAAGYALLALWRALQHAADGGGEGQRVVGVGIEAVGSPGLFETRACAGHHGQAAADSLDDRDAEALVARGIDECLGTGVELRERAVGDAVQEGYARRQPAVFGIPPYGVGVWRVAAYDDEAQVVGQMVQRLDGKEDVLARLYGAHGEQVAPRGDDGLQGLWQQALRSRCSGEARCAALIDYGDAPGRGDGAAETVGIVENVATGTLADGNDVVGLAERLTEFTGIDAGVEPAVVLRVAQEDKVVDGDHGADSRPPDAYGQFARETVEQLHAVAQQVAADTL